MGLPDFKKIKQDVGAVPQWAKELKEGEFISYQVSYPTRNYLNLFDAYVYPCVETGDIRYYVYNPVKYYNQGEVKKKTKEPPVHVNKKK